MKSLQKIALLIDADNTQLSKIEYVIREISTHGRIVVKRAYGNWKKEGLKHWESEIKRLAIKAEQQFDYVAGKNATDMALVIDAIELLHRGIYDAFVIVSSDSDFTPLSIKIHESGIYVMGVGEKKTPEAFKNSCDEFIFLENLEDDINEKTSNEGNEKVISDDINEIHSLLRIASDKYQDDDGFVNVSSVGSFIKRAKPDFDPRTYGFEKLPRLIEAFPDKYEMTKYAGKGTVNIIAYRCKQDKKQIHALVQKR
ncbi:NYN domain-containing protein [Sulfurospirillum barnesii]|uniref:HTH OST-type domain-containing protein n=1 Tax=Sulfurospirillum barnesii (strain ATCC 700032 / DSM 10660 / SES-3) TaxID=760154 RepID=I3Y0M1_SULBS|nr:NYN domain-containing protein [Sulfurospirillum barnesii]AFL69745.1 hypothetical protein Sulba_2478 [Sulfurospirillum barnesii SES-3]